MSGSGVKLFAEGCLGTCWSGRYHYLEPWIGCEHNCHYCYARFRNDVREALAQRNTSFEKPVAFFDEDRLIAEIARTVKSGINIVKLSRYTDIFSPKFVENGLSHKVLKVLVESPVARVIITTKGLPDEKIIELLSSCPEKFSYNLVAKPASAVQFESKLASLTARLEVARRLKKAGLLVTVHMDPIVPGIEDDEALLHDFFDTLKAYELNRVMFSFLLLSSELMQYMRNQDPSDCFRKIIDTFELTDENQVLPNQGDTHYNYTFLERRTEKANMIARMLSKKGFEFVFCSLKNRKKGEELKVDCTICNGSFYA